MKSFNISLDTVEKVKDFSESINKFDGELDIVCGNYVIDAKSIMGIFSLDLKNPLILNANDISDMEEFEKSISKFMV